MSRTFLTFFICFCSVFFAERYSSYHVRQALSTRFFVFLFFLSSFSKVLKTNQDERRRRDLNPRAAVNDLHPFQGCPFGQLGYFSSRIYAIFIYWFILADERREWDSNPRALADKRFSRPPRYDHFDISPARFIIYKTMFFSCHDASRMFMFPTISSPLLKSAQE